MREQQGCMRKEDKGEMDRNRKFRIHFKASDVTDKILEREREKQKKKIRASFYKPKLNGEEIQACRILRDRLCQIPASVMTTRGQDAAIKLCVILRQILKIERPSCRYRLLTSNNTPYILETKPH